MVSDRVQKVLQRIDAGKKIIDQHRPFSPAVLNRLRDQLVVDWTYNSNAIEGNTLTLNETRLVLEDGLTVGGKSLKEHLEAINHRDAISFVEELAGDASTITERQIKEIHSLVLREIDPGYAGRYRDIMVRISGSNHLPPDPLHLEDAMKKFAGQWLDTVDGHPIVRAARAHYELVAIHPFVDGNGRTGRLLMNLILMKNGHVPAVILKNDRRKYYDALEKAHSGKTDDFIIFVARALERTMYLYLEAIPDVATHFVTMTEAAKISPYSKDYLNILARRGAIPAFKLKRNWLVTREALEGYINKRKK